MFQVVLRGLQGYLKDVYKVCLGTFSGVTNFQRSFKEVLREFQESFKGISR